jgi:glutamate-1-semialdehyde 2,1-aminomutase
MAAANASFELSQKNGVASYIQNIGKFFSSKLEVLTANHGLPLKMTGPPSMPYPFIEGDSNLYKIQKFCQNCAEVGLYFHPHHNWFLGSSHSERDMIETLDRVEVALTRFQVNER